MVSVLGIPIILGIRRISEFCVNKISIEKYGDITFTFKPYAVIDGVKYYGAAYSVVFNDGARK